MKNYKFINQDCLVNSFTQQLILLLLITISFKSLAGGIILPPQIVSVGAGGSCQYNSIQTAINAVTPNSEIRIVNDKTYFENIQISDNNVSLKGGYTSCQDASDNVYNDQIYAIIDGSSILSVMRVNGAIGKLTLTNLVLINGSGISGGGITINSSDFDAFMHNVTVMNNKAIVGGGIYITGERNYMEISGVSSIFNNQADNAGGIYCDNTYMRLTDKSGVSFNYANGNNINNGFGGGIYGATDCELNISSGVIDEENTSQSVGISANKANNSGGGIYLDGSNDTHIIYRKLIASENTFIPINIDNNIANFNEDNHGDGGGIFLKKANMTSTNLYLDNNHVYGQGNGGGIYAFDSRLALYGNNHCKPKDKYFCNRISRNTAINGNGGAIYALGSLAPTNKDLMSNVYFVGNKADSGSVLSTSFRTTEIISSYFVNNGTNGLSEFLDNSTLNLSNQSDVKLVHVTLAENYTNSIIESSSLSELTIENAILTDSSGTHILSDEMGTTTSISCSIVDNLTDLESNSLAMLLNVLESQPSSLFVDSLSNYHLKPNALAVDFCTQSTLLPVNYDRDFQNFGLNIPEIGSFPVMSRIYDAGADEYVDLIFSATYDK